MLLVEKWLGEMLGLWILVCSLIYFFHSLLCYYGSSSYGRYHPIWCFSNKTCCSAWPSICVDIYATLVWWQSMTDQHNLWEIIIHWVTAKHCEEIKTNCEIHCKIHSILRGNSRHLLLIGVVWTVSQKKGWGPIWVRRSGVRELRAKKWWVGYSLTHLRQDRKGRDRENE